MTTATDTVDKTRLFQARTEGYKCYRVPGILCTSKGIILATAEARPDKGGDYSNNDIVMRRSLDGGETWEPYTKVVDHAIYGEGPASNFCLIEDRDSGIVHAVFCHDYARVFHMTSSDQGETFSEPREITAAAAALREQYNWAVVATGPGHGIQLRNGRFVVPVWMSDGSGGEFGPKHRGHRPSIVTSLFSDDRGETWQAGELVVKHGDVCDGTEVVNPSETVPVELADGRVLFNIRSESMRNRRLVSISPDGATDWSAPRFDDALLEPVCMGSILRVSRPEEGGSKIVFANPDTLEKEMRRAMGQTNPDRPHCDRKNVTVRMSTDECQTWSAKRLLQEGPSGYTDLGLTPDGTILCIYEDGVVDRMHDDRYVTVARFTHEWILADR